MKDNTVRQQYPNRTSTTSSTPRWSQDRRLEFLDFRLQWDGHVNRSDLTNFFGISIPQASLDIARYLERAPYNLEYDRSSRSYVALETFRPLYVASEPGRYLNELLATATGVLPTEDSFIGWYPPLDVVPNPDRLLNQDILIALLHAIRDKQTLEVVYQSMSRPEPFPRAISPHAFAYDGFRWHIRAYCHSRNEFLDFVIARMLKAEQSDIQSPDPNEDLAWHNILELILVPNPELTPARRKAIEMDYGMTRGETILPCRQALLFYELKRLGLTIPQNSVTPASQQIVLKNVDEISKYL